MVIQYPLSGFMSDTASVSLIDKSHDRLTDRFFVRRLDERVALGVHRCHHLRLDVVDHWLPTCRPLKSHKAEPTPKLVDNHIRGPVELGKLSPSEASRVTRAKPFNMFRQTQIPDNFLGPALIRRTGPLN